MTTILEWLTGLGLGQYADAFAENEIDFNLLPRLTGDDLREIGVKAVGHRRVLLDAIQSLGDPIPPPQDQRREAGERRQVCILFADLVGFSRMSSELDAEEVRRCVDAYFEMTDAAVIRNGGAVDKHIGDCVMGVFGAPVSHGDDILRAVRAATQIRDGISEISARLGRRLDMHAGLAAGEVMAAGSGGPRGEYAVTGEAVNLASRLCDKAQAGEILVSEDVRNAVDRQFEFSFAGALELKGFPQPHKAWRAGQAAAPEKPAMRPLVGREAERRQFAAALESCRNHGTGQTIVVRGEPGIGKSRLMEHFAAAAERDGFQVLRGLVFDFGGDAGRDAMMRIITALVAFLPGDGEGLLARILASDLAVAEKAALASYLKLESPDDLRQLYAAMDGTLRMQRLCSALVRIANLSAGNRNLLFLVEDAHWAGPETRELLQTLSGVAARGRAMLAISTRIEGDIVQHGWMPAGALLTFNLAPLSPAESIELAGILREPDAANLQRCVERAAGNPLFLEQLLKNRQPDLPDSIPATIQSVVQARMDALPDRDRQALQAGAVLGHAFLLPDLRAMIGDPAYNPALLVGRQLLRPHEGGFMFCHALIRDAAYAVLLHRHKRDLHRRAATLLAERDDALATEHLILAKDDEAVAAVARLADRMIGEYRYDRAAELVDRAMALAGADTGKRHRLLALKGNALVQSGRAGEALEVYGAALQAAELPKDRASAHLGIASARRILDQIDPALADVEAALVEATHADAPEEQARAHILRGNLLFPRGQFAESVAACERALAIARQIGSTELEANALSGLGDAEYLRGAVLASYQNFSDCVSLATAHGLRRIEVSNLPMRAIMLSMIGDKLEALGQALQAIDLAGKIGHERARMIGHHAALISCRNLLRLDEARQHAAEALSIARKLKSPRFEAEGLAFIGSIDADAGKPGEARLAFDEALQVARTGDFSYFGPVILGGMARVATDEAGRHRAIAEAEAVLAAGALYHNHLIFRGDMIELGCRLADWRAVRHHAMALRRASLEQSAISLIADAAEAIADASEGDLEAARVLSLLASRSRAGNDLRMAAMVDQAISRLQPA